MTDIERLEVRAREAVAQLFNHRLSIPDIFFEAPWPDEKGRVELLAVDRAGTGDLHVVEIRYDSTKALEAIAKLMCIPAHFRWVAFFRETVTQQLPAGLDTRQLFPQSGPGRVGLIEILRSDKDDLSAEILVIAERFVGLKYSQIDPFEKKHEPDMCVR